MMDFNTTLEDKKTLKNILLEIDTPDLGFNKSPEFCIQHINAMGSYLQIKKNEFRLNEDIFFKTLEKEEALRYSLKTVSKSREY